MSRLLLATIGLFVLGGISLVMVLSAPSADVQAQTTSCSDLEGTATPGPTPSPDDDSDDYCTNASSTTYHARAPGAGGASNTQPNIPTGESSLPFVARHGYGYPDGSGGMIYPYRTPVPTQANATSTAIRRFSHAIHYLECDDPCPNNTSTGVSAFEANLSTRPAVLTTGAMHWQNYHYFNRMHVLHPGKSITCPDGRVYNPFLSVGYAQGKFKRANLYNGEIIVEAYYRAPATATSRAKVVCEEIATGIFPDDPSALTFRMYWTTDVDDDLNTWLNGAWKIDVWLGYWRNLAVVPTGWKTATAVEYGQELWARNQDRTSVRASLNFGHKATLTDHNGKVVPWHESVLPSHLQGRSGTTKAEKHKPFSITDIRGGDYTSIATCVPVDDYCE